ncbi:MAG: Spy/CpxP family protein refolding chaperone [Brachymonas sp.]|nr:Spy/CpxP family protein refolding chaperone [Brachymonas sp.]
MPPFERVRCQRKCSQPQKPPSGGFLLSLNRLLQIHTYSGGITQGLPLHSRIRLPWWRRCEVQCCAGARLLDSQKGKFMRQFAKMFAKPLLAVALLGAFGAPALAQQGDPLAAFKSDLKITAAQEGAWKKFVDVHAIPPQPTQQLTAEQFNALKTPERIAFLKKMRTEETSFLSNRLDASLALYNALDEGQKKVFDEITAERPPQQQAPARAPAKAQPKKK